MKSDPATELLTGTGWLLAIAVIIAAVAIVSAFVVVPIIRLTIDARQQRRQAKAAASLVAARHRRPALPERDADY